MIIHTCYYRVRYRDTDQMGYMYYGNYAFLYEIGRTEAMRSIGLSYKHMEKEMGVMMPVARTDFRYIRPAYYDDLLRIQTTLKDIPDKRITFYSEIFNENDELVNGGWVTLGFVDAKTFKTTVAPPYFIKVIKPHFG